MLKIIKTIAEVAPALTRCLINGLVRALRASWILESLLVPLVLKLQVRRSLVAKRVLEILLQAIGSVATDPILRHHVQLLLPLVVILGQEDCHYVLVDGRHVKLLGRLTVVKSLAILAFKF